MKGIEDQTVEMWDICEIFGKWSLQDLIVMTARRKRRVWVGSPLDTWKWFNSLPGKRITVQRVDDGFGFENIKFAMT